MNQWLGYITRQAHVAARHATVAYVECVQRMFDIFEQYKAKNGRKPNTNLNPATQAQENQTKTLISAI